MRRRQKGKKQWMRGATLRLGERRYPLAHSRTPSAPRPSGARFLPPHLRGRAKQRRPVDAIDLEAVEGVREGRVPHRVARPRGNLLHRPQGRVHLELGGEVGKGLELGDKGLSIALRIDLTKGKRARGQGRAGGESEREREKGSGPFHKKHPEE